MNKVKKADAPSDQILIRAGRGQQARFTTHLPHTKCYVVGLEASEALPDLQEPVIASRA